jgi:hypothetical protein
MSYFLFAFIVKKSIDIRSFLSSKGNVYVNMYMLIKFVVDVLVTDN